MRALEVAENLMLAASTALRGLREDPLEMLIQVSRRLPRAVPGRFGRLVAVGDPGSLRRSYAEWISDRPDQARKHLGSVPPRARGRLFTELANQLDASDLIPALRLRGPLARRVAVRRGQVVEPAPAFAARTPATPTTARNDGEPLAVFHLLTNSVPHTSSGYAHRSHAVLRAQRDAGLRVAAATRLGYPVVVGKVRAARCDVVDGIEYFRLVRPLLGGSIAERTRQAADLLEPIVRDFGADVLSTTTDYTNALVAQEVAYRLGIPWTYEVRGLPEDTWVAGKADVDERAHAAGSARYTQLQGREAAAAVAADHVFTLGAALREDFVSRGVNAGRVTVVENASDGGLLESVTPGDVRARLGLPQAGFWVGTVSSLVDYEGLGTVLGAVAAARAQDEDVRALLVGDGVARPGLEEQARALGLRLGLDVVFAGRVPSGDVAAYHQALNVFVVPRVDERVCRLVQPLKPFGAMTAGRPIIASDLPALRDLLGPARCGALVPPGDVGAWTSEILRFAQEPKLAVRLGENGRTYARNRTWSEQGIVYADVLRTLAGLGVRDV